MKKILSIILTLACILTVFCSCDSLNKQPVTLADSILVPENGIIEASVFEMLKDENKAVTFKGQAGDILYEWVIFGSDIKEAKALNLGIEIIKEDSETLSFRFLSEEDFGFSPVLSIYLNEVWDAQSCTLYEITDLGNTEKQTVSITGERQTVLNFSPEITTGSFVITPDIKPDETDKPSSDVLDSSDIVPSENNKPLQDTDQSDSQTPVTDNKNPTLSEPSTDKGQIVSDGKTETDSDSKDDNTEKTYTCTISIECTSVFNNLKDLDPDKLDIIPKDGIILAEKTVTFYEGESVYDVLQRVCRENFIHMEASFTPLYNSSYIEGIGNLYEFDCGSTSGWMYRVDGWYPNYGCSRYQLKQGEKIEWRYSCNLGKDIGGGNVYTE